MSLLQFKQAVLEKIESHLGEKSDELHAYAKELNQQLADESKSSAGDKYETARAMLHLEQEKMQRQFHELSAQQAQLERLKSIVSTDVVSMGSLLQAQEVYFYVGIGLGKLNVQGISVFCIAAEAPLGKTLLGKKRGDIVNFLQRAHRIDQLA